MLIDTHAHINFNAYKQDADEVIRRSLDNDIWIINVGSQYSTSKRAIELSQKYKEGVYPHTKFGVGVYAAVGLHPIHAEDGFDYEKYKQLAQSPGVVAIGETGLDYKEEYAPFKEEQKEVFLKQLKMAKELSLPIIFHCRMAHDDLINILNSQFLIHNFTKLEGVVHCFTGSWIQAEKYLAMGLYLGFNGIIFKMNLDDIIKRAPLEKILIETDCPYLTPSISINQRSDQRKSASTIRNEPIYVRYIAEKIAKIKNLTPEQVAEATAENAKKLFKI